MHSIERGKPHPLLYCAPSPLMGRGGFGTVPYIGHLKLACRFYLLFFVALTPQVYFLFFLLGGQRVPRRLRRVPRRRTPPKRKNPPCGGMSEGTARREGRAAAQAKRQAKRDRKPKSRPTYTACGSSAGVPHGAAEQSRTGRHNHKEAAPTLGRRGCRRAERRVEGAAQKKTNPVGFFSSAKKTVKKAP